MSNYELSNCKQNCSFGDLVVNNETEDEYDELATTGKHLQG